MPRTTRVIPKRVTEAREARDWSQAELARRAKLSQPTVWALENGQTQEVKLSTVAKLALATGRPLEYFTGSADVNVVQQPDAPYTRIPVISWVQAGKRNPVHDPYPPGAAEDWEDVTVPISRVGFALRVRGDSMVAPDGSGFPDGAVIAIDPTLAPVSGDYVVMRFNDSDEATFKKFVIDGPNRLLRPLNPAYPTITIGEDAQLVGVVVECNVRRRFR